MCLSEEYREKRTNILEILRKKDKDLRNIDLCPVIA